MKNVKMLLIAAATLAALCGSVSAQKGAGTNGARAPKPAATAQTTERWMGNDFHRALAQLNLTDAQRSQIQAIEQSLRARLQALRADKTLTKEQKKQQATVLTRQARQAIVAVLTPEQQARLHAILKNKAGQAVDRFWEAVARLNLSETQKTQIAAIRVEARATAAQIQQSSATPEQKRAQFKALSKATHERVLTLLTPEQRERLRKMLANNPDNRLWGRLEDALRQLHLPQATMTQIRALFQDARARAAVVRANRTLTPDQKKEQIRAIAADLYQRILGVLTPAQRTQLQQMMKSNPALADPGAGASDL